jgi:hypothetical protein
MQTRMGRETQNREPFFQEHFHPIYRFVYSYVRNQQEAEDLTSQIFLKAMRLFDLERSTPHQRAWLFRVARTTIADYWRAASRPGCTCWRNVGDPQTRSAGPLLLSLSSLLGLARRMTLTWGRPQRICNWRHGSWALAGFIPQKKPVRLFICPLTSPALLFSLLAIPLPSRSLTSLRSASPLMQ